MHRRSNHKTPAELCDRPVEPGSLAVSEVAALVNRDDPVILEIGANDGQHSKAFLRTFPRCRLFCFEPDHRAIERWRARITNPRATLFEGAIGATDGTAAFHMSAGREDQVRDGWCDSGSLRPPKEHLRVHPDITFPRVIDVPCLRLDTWLASAKLTRIDFIWMDVQGAERDVIAGGAEALAMTRWLYTEYSNKELYEGQANLAELCGLLPEFALRRRFKGDALFQARSRPSRFAALLNFLRRPKVSHRG